MQHTISQVVEACAPRVILGVEQSWLRVAVSVVESSSYNRRNKLSRTPNSRINSTHATLATVAYAWCSELVHGGAHSTMHNVSEDEHEKILSLHQSYYARAGYCTTLPWTLDIGHWIFSNRFSAPFGHQLLLLCDTNGYRPEEDQIISLVHHTSH